jgi:membrane fusion protein, copper/silver efflux system
MYSPEMLASQQEYLLALKSREILRGSSVPALREDRGALVEAARRRLQHWNLSEEQIRQVERTGEPLRTITLHAPASGYVTARNAFPGQRVAPETELYTIVDLSRVWVMADVFESEAGTVQIGQRAAITAAAYPGRRFTGTVAYIQPQLNATTRTLQVRIEMQNPGLVMKPDMFVTVDLASGTQPRMVVPVNAVLNSGLRQVVYVDRGNGHLEPRNVQVGQAFGDRIEILSGLKPGERIVTSGTFLIDSESQLQSAASGASEPAGGHQHD